MLDKKTHQTFRTILLHSPGKVGRHFMQILFISDICMKCQAIFRGESLKTYHQLVIWISPESVNGKKHLLVCISVKQTPEIRKDIFYRWILLEELIPSLIVCVHYKHTYSIIAFPFMFCQNIII